MLTHQQRQFETFFQLADGSWAQRVGDLANQFSVPSEADAFTREVSGNNVIYKFRQGGIAGTILKTVTLYYSSPQDATFTGGEVS